MTTRELIQELLKVDNLDNECHLIYSLPTDKNIFGIHNITGISIKEMTWDTLIDFVVENKELEIDGIK